MKAWAERALAHLVGHGWQSISQTVLTIPIKSSLVAQSELIFCQTRTGTNGQRRPLVLRECRIVSRCYGEIIQYVEFIGLAAVLLAQPFAPKGIAQAKSDCGYLAEGGAAIDETFKFALVGLIGMF